MDLALLDNVVRVRTRKAGAFEEVHNIVSSDVLTIQKEIRLGKTDRSSKAYLCRVDLEERVTHRASQKVLKVGIVRESVCLCYQRRSLRSQRQCSLCRAKKSGKLQETFESH